MFFTHRDGAVRSRIRRRLKSSRASVYLEYAIILPLVVMFVSALIEFTSIWDAKIMANHAAWTVGRIATVRPKMVFSEKLSDKLSSGITDSEMSSYMKAFLSPLDAVMKGANKLNNCGNVATLFLMSTCSNGYWGESASADVRNLLEKMLKAPLEKLQENLKTWVTESIVNHISDLVPSGIAGPVGELVKNILTSFIEDIVFKPLSQLVGNMTELLFPTGLFDWIQASFESDRAVRGVFYATTRIAKCNVVTVEKLTNSPFAFSSHLDGYGTSHRLSFPRCLDNYFTIRDKVNQVETDSPWPPNAQLQPMYKVKVAWPYERTWLFPIVSGYEKVPSEDGLAKPAAVGWSLVYTQPDIANTNLLAEGAEVFADGTQTNEFADILKEVQGEIQGFMKTVAFGMRYRLGEEKIGAYDSSKPTSSSYKGLGLYDANGLDHYTDDGLVYWMGRAPNPEKHGDNKKAWKAWYNEWQKRDTACKSYNKSWNVRTGGKKQTTSWSSVKANLDNLSRTRSKLWWFWTLEEEPKDSAFRRRYTTTTMEPLDNLFVSGTWHKRKMTDFTVFSNRVVSEADGYTFYMTNALLSKVVAEADYKKWKDPKPAYADYQTMAKKIPQNQTAWLMIYKAKEAALLGREEGYTYTNAVLCTRFATLTKLVRDCAIDLENQNEGEMPEDEDGKLDWGADEEEMWKEPKKAAEKMRKKLEEMKKTNFTLLQEIDDAIDDIYSAWPEANSGVESACAARKSLLLDFHKRLANVMCEPAPTADADEVVRRLKDAGTGVTTEYETTFATAEAKLKAVAEALERAYAAEIAYGKLFKLRAAREAGDKHLSDLDPGEGDDPVDPNIPPESGSQTGTDDDWGGESWTRGAPGEGWKQ